MGRRGRDLRERLRVRVDVHGAVGEEKRLLRQHQHVDAAHVPAPGLRADHLERRAHGVGIVHVDAGHDRVDLAGAEHQQGVVQRVDHPVASLAQRDAFAAPALPQLLGERLEVVAAPGIRQRDVLERHAGIVRLAADRVRVAEQRRLRHAVIRENAGGLEDAGVLALGKCDPLRRHLGTPRQAAHHLPRAPETGVQLRPVLVDVDHPARHTGAHRRPRYGRRHPQKDPGIERFWDQVVGTEPQPLDAIGAHHRIRHLLLGQGRERARRRHLHLLVDLLGTHVERPAENEREAQHVVHLIGIVRAAGRDDRVTARLARLFRCDLRIGIGQREHDRTFGHPLEHLPRDDAPHRQSHEHVRVRQGVREGPGLPPDREPAPVLVQVATVGVHDPMLIA